MNGIDITSLNAEISLIMVNRLLEGVNFLYLPFNAANRNCKLMNSTKN
jgi:hypothetical protein